MNIKKLFAILAGVSMVANVVLPGLAHAATPDTELGKAYEWAYSKSITTMPSYEAANMKGKVTRAELAKMLSNWAMNVRGMTPDTSKTCEFTDTASVKGDLGPAITTSCQLGLMGQGIPAFRPYDNVSRAEFGTALSRALWGGKYDGGTPYYKNHLQALKAAGIMNYIDGNWPASQEVRGYVMLMLMRVAEGGETADPETPSEEVVKSGDLSVTAKAAEGKKALIGGVSDLDTLTFKTSEDVTISSVTLERYGYSTKEQVKTVQLEDEDGNIIADAKEINNKGQVKLTLKKDYKTVDGIFRATIVLDANDLETDNGSTIGFKVVAVESTAKNLNLDDYDPYTYDLVNYKGSAVEFSDRNSDKNYNWESGKLYEVAKFRVKAPADANILVRGFTLTDSNKNKIEADKFAKDVTVTVDGKEVKGLKWNINKDDELVVSFSEVEIEGKKTASIAVNMSFNEEFDNFNEFVNYTIAKLPNFNATDKKTGTRIIASEDKPLSSVNWAKYTFKGGKVKISGSKLGLVNAAANSTNVLVASGDITITEALKGTARIIVKENDFIDGIRLVISGEEYDGTKVKTKIAGNTFNTGDVAMNEAGKKLYRAKGKVTGWGDGSKWEEVGVAAYEFKGLEIEKSGKVEVRVDLKDDAEGTMKFAGSLNSSSFDLQYEESREIVGSQLVGSISVSDVKAQAARASLTKKEPQKAELVKDETNRKTIFNGTYEAKKGKITLKQFVITTNGDLNITPDPTFYVTIDDEEYDADWTNGEAKGDIDDIEVDAGKSVNVKVEIEVVPTVANVSNTFNIALSGEDEESNPAGDADEDTARVEVVTQGTIDVTDVSTKKTVLLRTERKLAEFRIKPSKSSEDDIILNSMKVTLRGLDDDYSKLKFDIDGDSSYKTTDGKFSDLGISIPAEGIKVVVSLKSEVEEPTKVEFAVDTINGKDINSKFSKYYVPATVKITQNNGKGKDTTTYTVALENDTSNTVGSLKMYVNSGSDACTFSDNKADANNCTLVAEKDTLSEGSSADNKLSATNGETAKSITAIQYKVGDSFVEITKADFENFFEKANGDDDLMVYSNRS